MAKLRSVSVGFWSDPFVEELTSDQKLLYLYLITNDKTNMLGVYELSLRKISYDTSIKKEIIEEAFEVFNNCGKLKKVGNYIILLNFTKNQNYNTNMMKSAIDVYNSLPIEVRNGPKISKKVNPSEGFERVRKGLGMVRKIEAEIEVETETETETEKEAQSEKEKRNDWSESAFLNLWNETMENKVIPKITKFNENRVKLIDNLLDVYSKAEIYEVIQKAAKSKFLNGQGKGKFIAGFDWVMQPENFIKIMEGNYRNAGPVLDMNYNKDKSK